MNYIALYPYSAIFYSSILVIATLLAYFQIFLKPNLKRIVLIIIIVFLSLCAGFRAETVGTDTRAYMAFIESCRPGNNPLSWHVEPGFKLLVKSILFIIDSPQIVLIVIALIVNSLIIIRLWSYKDKISFPFSVFIYTSQYYLMTYSGIRQWIAVALIFYASKYVLEHKHLIFGVFVFLAASFHYSAFIAFVYLPMHLFFWKDVLPKHKRIILISLFFSPFLCWGLFELISRSGLIIRYAHLLTDDFYRLQIGRYLFIKLIIVFFAISFAQLKSCAEDRSFYREITLFYFWGLLLTFSAYFFRNISRIGWYFMVYEMVFFSAISKTKGVGRLLKYFVVIIMLYVFYQNLKGSSESHMPYAPFWIN